MPRNNNNNRTLPSSSACTRGRHVSTHGHMQSRFKTTDRCVIYLAAVSAAALFLCLSCAYLNWAPRSSFSAFHCRSPIFAARWKDGGMWRRWRKRRRRREVSEVRKSGSLLATQLRGWDLCRFQGSVRPPEQRQVHSLQLGSSTSAKPFKIKVTFVKHGNTCSILTVCIPNTDDCSINSSLDFVYIFCICCMLNCYYFFL